METNNRGSKYAYKLTVAQFRERLQDCTFDMCILATDSFGTVNKLHAYVHPHAWKNLKFRASSNCSQLIVEWFRDAVKSKEILEDILVANDEAYCDKFMVLDRDWNRVITFSILPTRTEYVILLQSVFFLSESKEGIFYVGTPDAFCYSTNRHGETISGVENIPEMKIPTQGFCGSV